MSPLAVILNIFVVVGIVGIIVYWVRRFAVFRGYKAIEQDVLKIAEVLKGQPVRQGRDVMLSGYYGGFPAILRFSQRLNTPGLDLQMRVPGTFAFTLLPKSAALRGEGRVVMRIGSAVLDRKFNARTDQPMELRIFAGTAPARASLEQLCCSSQSGLTLKQRVLRLTELTIPEFTASHVLDHLESMRMLAKRLENMPGGTEIVVQPLPPAVKSWPIRLALCFGLIALVAILLTQPYGAVESSSRGAALVNSSGVEPADAVHMQHLQGWHLAKPEELSETAIRFARNRGATRPGHIVGDFSGSGSANDSAYLLINNEGKRRVCLLAGSEVAYDAIFPKVDLLARIPKASFANIKWIAAPRTAPDGDALLVIENIQDPSASLVLLKHGVQIDSARPADFTQIDLASE
jgi:hypothetical protein